MTKKVGTVYLVGAGPGNPKLITVCGRELLESCNVVIYDSLISKSLLDHAKHALKIYAGKSRQKGKHVDQAKIEKWMIHYAKQGKSVVRLKGGDPFIFGRGGDEALALSEAGISFEIVPGVTAAVGAAAYAGIPMTHRRMASDVTFITAHEDPNKADSRIDWKSAASQKGTLVIYMGVEKLEHVAERLIKLGKSAVTPAAVIQWGTMPQQKTLTGTLGNIAKAAKASRIQSPAMVVIGEVVTLRKQLAWFEEKPLFGKTVVVTRPRRQAGALAELLENQGARVVEIPTVEIGPVRNWKKVDRAIRQISKYTWIIFTSENGVQYFMKRLEKINLDARKLSSVKIAAVGPGTSKKLSEYSLKADFVPKTYSTEGLFQGLKRKKLIRKNRFLLVRTTIATDVLSKSIEKEGGFASELPIYETRKLKLNRAKVKKAVEAVDYVTFTSASTANNFFSLFSARELKQLKSRYVSIGPVTSEAIRSFKVPVYKEAKPYTIPALVSAISNGNGKH